MLMFLGLLGAMSLVWWRPNLFWVVLLITVIFLVAPHLPQHLVAQR